MPEAEDGSPQGAAIRYQYRLAVQLRESPRAPAFQFVMEAGRLTCGGAGDIRFSLFARAD